MILAQFFVFRFISPLVVAIVLLVADAIGSSGLC